MTYRNSTAGGKRFPRESADGLIPHGIILVCKFWEINNRVYLEALSKVTQSHPWKDLKRQDGKYNPNYLKKKKKQLKKTHQHHGQN